MQRFLASVTRMSRGTDAFEFDYMQEFTPHVTGRQQGLKNKNNRVQLFFFQAHYEMLVSVRSVN